MSYTIKCPFCAEEINSDANICKHCQRKVTDSESKNKIKSQIRKIEIKKLNEELKDKINLYPEKIKKNIINNKQELEKIQKMNNDEINMDIFNRERKSNINKLWIVSIVLFFIFPPILAISIWLHPKKDEKDLFKNRLKEFKNYSGRIFLSIFVLIIGFSILGTNENNNTQNIVVTETQTPILNNENNLPENTITAKKVNIKATYDIPLDYTDKSVVNIKVELENIKKLLINNNEVQLGTGNVVTYKLPLILGDNNISIVGSYDNFKKQISKNIRRVNNMNKEKKRLDEIAKQQEENAKIEQEKLDKANAEEKVKSQFSAWDGSHIQLSKYVQSRLKDPDSYQHIETRYSVVKNKDNSFKLVVFMSYRAKNSFGGYVVENVKAFFDLDGNPINLENWITS